MFATSDQLFFLEHGKCFTGGRLEDKTAWHHAWGRGPSATWHGVGGRVDDVVVLGGWRLTVSRGTHHAEEILAVDAEGDTVQAT